MKEFFDAAWQDLKQVYFNGDICSERHMQCELFRILTNNKAFSREHQIFVEPRFTEPRLKSVIPDFLILSRITMTVVAAVELKYVPHAYSKSKKDLDTLISFLKLFKNDPKYSFPLKTNPSNGDWAEKFCFDEQLTLIYCIITKVDAYIITNPEELWELDGNFIDGKISYCQYVGAIPADSNEKWKRL